MATKVSEHDYSEVFQVLRKSIPLRVCHISEKRLQVRTIPMVGQ